MGKEAVLIHHRAVHHGIHERLAVVGGQFERVAQPGGFCAAGAGSGAYEDVDQRWGRHVGAIQRRNEDKVSPALQARSSMKKNGGEQGIVCYMPTLYAI